MKADVPYVSVVDVVGESPVTPEPEQPGASMTLPAKDETATARERDPRVELAPKRLITTPVLALSILAATAAFALAAMQVTRAMNGDERIGVVTWIEIGTAVLAAIGAVTWTWMVVENARRLLAAAVSQNPLSPKAAAMSWLLPLVVATAAIGTVAYLERSLNESSAESTSPIPLAIACGALIVTLFVSYRPMFMLSAMMRRLGSGAGDLARWVWVPISLAIVGGFTLFGLRSGGAYGEDFEGVAPAWAIGVVFVPPVVIVLMLAWRGGRLVEDAVRVAYDRRNGIVSTGVGHGTLGLFARALRADARPPIARDVRTRIRLAPGAGIVRLAMMISLAALTLISIVGALVMFLFWREAADGALLPAQRERAWSSLDGLQSLERLVALGATCVAAIWAFVNVLNARIATGRRRNPILAAAAWPGAAVAIWMIADRVDDTEQVGSLVLRFALQAAVLYVPFFLLERSAVAVGARRTPLRLAYALGVVLLVHIQGLGGLATLVEETDVDRFGRIAGYLALAALLELIATVAITESSRVVSDAASAVAEKHNFLADQRSNIDQRVASVAPGPTIAADHDSTATRRPAGAVVGDLVVGHDAASVDPGIPVPSRDAVIAPDQVEAADEPKPADHVPPTPPQARVAQAPVAPTPAAQPPATSAVETPVADVVPPAPPSAPVSPVPATQAPTPTSTPRPDPRPVTPDPAPTAAPASPAPSPAATPSPVSSPVAASVTPSASADAASSFSIPKLVHRSVVSDAATTSDAAADSETSG